MGTNIANKFKEELAEPKNKIIITGKANEARTEPSETYFVIKNITTKTKNEYIAASGCNPINKPSIVAIPFPPLKPV